MLLLCFFFIRLWFLCRLYCVFISSHWVNKQHNEISGKCVGKITCCVMKTTQKKKRNMPSKRFYKWFSEKLLPQVWSIYNTLCMRMRTLCQFPKWLNAIEINSKSFVSNFQSWGRFFFRCLRCVVSVFPLTWTIKWKLS